MKSFNQLTEVNKNTVVLAFGRMNPVTNGHQKLINKVLDIAKKNNADHYIYASKTQDKKKNPLSIVQKLKYLKHSFSQVNIVGADNTVRTPIEAVKFLDSKYDSLIFIAGSDRVADFQKLFDTYNGKEYNYSSIKVVSAGDRDPDADDVTGMSASKMRQMAIDNNFDQFKTGIPSTMKDQVAKQMFNDVRSGMNVREEYAVERREKYLREELFRVGDIVEHNGEESAIVHRGSNYVLLEDNKKAWLTDIFETDKVDMEMVYKAQEKLTVARIIGESFGVGSDKIDPVAIVNACLLKAKNMALTEAQLESLDNMLVIADDAGIPFDKRLAGMIEDCDEEEDDEELMDDKKDTKDDHLRRRKINYKIHEDEDELSDSELDSILGELNDDDYIEDAYEDDEFELVDEDTGEVLDEDYDFTELSEVLSRVERIRSRVRMRRTKSKRQRQVKIALKRRSNTQVLTRRARKMAVKTLKKRFIRNKPLNKLSVGEKERIEKRIAGMKTTVTRLATRMIPKMRQIEKGRFDARAAKGNK